MNPHILILKKHCEDCNWYYCPFCVFASKNGKELGEHIRYVHIKNSEYFHKLKFEVKK